MVHIDKKLIQLGAKIELARREFFYYCNLMAPDFYKSDRKYLVDLCNELQYFFYSDDQILIINEPPRHGKSRTATMFVQWILGKDNSQKIMTGSYNEKLSVQFSKAVRDTIQELKADTYKPVFSDVFPETRIKRGDGSMHLWSLEGGYNNYLATSPTGTATGFGASLMIIDDLIKNSMEANNADVLDKQWDWFTNTMLSRLEEGGKIIIIMTRWHSEDLAGRALNWCKEKGKKYRHICMDAIVNEETHEMLCLDVLSWKSAMDKKSAMGADIFSANYRQKPIDLQGRLYTSFKTYDTAPNDFEFIGAYCDTADDGSDNLCSIVYGAKNNEAYVLDIVYTKESMETTEGKVAKSYYYNDVNKALVESNNGGKGFARSVKRILEEKYNWNKTRVKWFHQAKNKQARILSNATWVMDHIYYPHNWKDRWPAYHDDMVKYQREGKNKHDDAPDATTGVAEQFNRKVGVRFD